MWALEAFSGANQVLWHMNALTTHTSHRVDNKDDEDV